MYLFLLLQSFLAFSALAQYPPPSNLTTITSPFDENVTISYKAPPPGTCATVFSTQQQYTGWVNIPGEYPTNTFFWFIAARQPTSQLTIWLNGGPGTSSMLGLFAETGPCEAIEIAQGKFGTRARNWGWDRMSNMLYIDQPNQVGFSYDTPTNGSLDLLTSNLLSPPQPVPSSQPATTFLNGTFSTLNVNNTANTTEIAGMAIWHMLQAFLVSFPQFGPINSTSRTLSVNLFAESYGGKYGPAFAALWERQNRRRLNGSLDFNGTVPIRLASLGIINGCVDDLIQGPFYPIMATNNTYGLVAINPTRANLANASFYAPGGCADLIKQCRSARALQDADDTGSVPAVNALCSQAYSKCTNDVMSPYSDSLRSLYDIGHLLPDSFPPSTYLEYLNTEEFQSAIGTPVNFTQNSAQVLSAFTSTGDYERDALVPQIAGLLNAGIRVGLIYGDRDYICNWLGGEAISQQVAALASPTYLARFPIAGYAPVIVNASYIGGVVRQVGNLSFSRIYDAGHLVPAYQPETAFQVFARIIGGTSISTGEIIDLGTYNTTGDATASHLNSLPASPVTMCWIRDIKNTCTQAQIQMILNNQGVIINGVLYDSLSQYNSMGSSLSTTNAGTQTQQSTTSQGLTGAYTATVTPSFRSGGGSLQDELWRVSWRAIWAMGIGSAVIVITL